MLGPIPKFKNSEKEKVSMYLSGKLVLEDLLVLAKLIKTKKDSCMTCWDVVISNQGSGHA